MNRKRHQWWATSNESNVLSCWTEKGHLPRSFQPKSGEERYTLYLTVQSGLVLEFNGAEIWKANRCYCSHYPFDPGAIHHNMLIIYSWSFSMIYSRLAGSFLHVYYSSTAFYYFFLFTCCVQLFMEYISQMLYFSFNLRWSVRDLEKGFNY